MIALKTTADQLREAEALLQESANALSTVRTQSALRGEEPPYQDLWARIARFLGEQNLRRA